MRVADIDGDGDPDLATISGNALRWWRNDGTGNFADVLDAFAPPLSLASSIAVGDVDNDGDPGPVASGYRRPTRLLRNDAAGRFTLSVGPVRTDARSRPLIVAVAWPGDQPGPWSGVSADPEAPASISWLVAQQDKLTGAVGPNSHPLELCDQALAGLRNRRPKNPLLGRASSSGRSRKSETSAPS